MRLVLILALTLCAFSGLLSQDIKHQPDSNKQQYLADQKIIARAFSNYFYPNYATIYSLPEKTFIKKIDSARNIFETLLNKYSGLLDKKVFDDEKLGINYYFDRILIDYPTNYATYAGKPAASSSTISKRLTKNLQDLNKPELLANAEFKDYVRAFLYAETSKAFSKGSYKNQDNQTLAAMWDIIPKWFTNATCADFWKFECLYSHIDNCGIKNVERIYRDFTATCKDTAYVNKITALYTADSIDRQGHLIKTYKTTGSFDLDIHVFLPDSMSNEQKKPVIVYFHGGSWSEGKPDWFFNACRQYAKQGWVACAVEYRISGRHGTVPFEAVKDARSAIRWVRENAGEFNIDTAKIVASGNSAGGHLVLATALADKWNESTDDLTYSPVPNVLLVNAGVFDLTDNATAWIRKNLKDKNTVKEISPNHLAKSGMPPTLLIHGTKDGSVPFHTAKTFEEAMRKAGNDFEFHALENAPHYIWYDPRYSPQVSKLRGEFLKKLGY